MSKTIASWSFSKLGDFESCKMKAKLKHLDKIPEPERPLPPGKAEHANDRGTRLHQVCEDFVNGTSDALVPEVMKFEWHLEFLRHHHAKGMVSLEGEWGYDDQWGVTDWSGVWVPVEGLAPTASAKVLPARGHSDDVIKVGKLLWAWQPTWLRAKLDAMVFHSDTEATVIDYKSGRKFGNEIKHAEQLQLYQLLAFMRYPKLEVVHAELWYLDQDEVTSKTYTRKQGLMFAKNFARRGNALTTTTAWPANPSKWACQYCAYKPAPDGTGHCAVGVVKTQFPPKKRFG